MKRLSIMMLVLAAAALTVQAAENHWDNDAGDNRWNNPLNWENDTLPLQSNAVIEGGAYVIAADPTNAAPGGINIRNSDMLISSNFAPAGVQDWRDTTIIVTNGAVVNAALGQTRAVTLNGLKNSSATLTITGSGSSWQGGGLGNYPFYAASAANTNNGFTLNVMNGGEYRGKFFMGTDNLGTPEAIDATVHVNVYSNSLAGTGSLGQWDFGVVSGEAKVNLLGGELYFTSSNALNFYSGPTATEGIFFDELGSKIVFGGDATNAVQGWIDDGLFVDNAGSGLTYSYDSISDETTVIPEPATIGLLIMSCAGLAILRRRAS
ncbi:PEP-CTERM sorting domain-containing protein [Kiritimatiella glycovorans]|uniref:PEP-CTERM protein-sorting domain-containing protein n=1 Tax=Kiritimatiella glycovorans TaxID=1307763 RepID=A0A0G3ELX7_9BACT|nr:PEP-CTERM sorting domain-containing protein [Kiritimatiella glycovorans]AKJ65164.1 hypothetical protein L21SP4_01929 [Kiritimatiella glycovorans]